MMREEKLYSAMYIAGTALAVAFVMLIAEVYYVKVADMAPEVRRSTTYYLDFLPLKSDPNKGAYLNHEVFRTLFQTMKTPECVTGAVVIYSNDRPYMKMADGLHDRAVTSKSVESGYFRFYEYRFVQGAPFTRDDFDNGRSVAVITDEISDLLFGRGVNAVGQTISVSNFDYRICGVVEAPSALMEESVADVWMPYTAKGTDGGWEVNWREAPIDITFSVPEARREAFMQELKEVEARYNSVHKGQEADVTSHLKSHYGKVWEGIADVFDAWNQNLIWYVAPAILLLLLVPALNLSGMVASRMERQLPEMAIRKAFGAKRRMLLEQVIMENLVLTLIGGIIGLCIAWTALYAWRDWVFYVFSDSSSLYGSVPIVRGEMLFGPAIFATALLVCCVLNVLAATVPAWLSLRKPIVESMMIKK